MKKFAYLFAAVLLSFFTGAVLLYLYLVPEGRDVAVADATTTRQLEAGQVIGFSEGGVSTWLGIPYAEAPTGELRWKAPRPAVRWTSKKEALTFGSACPQIRRGAVGGEEDCLFINIWSPGETTDRRYPVMFWIHGGGNSIGEAATSIYSGARLSREHDVVLVSINYRLGPLGWFRHAALRTESGSKEDNSGNFGTLDIVMALRWVKNNIAQFNGDPDNVTIFGESAGGFDVLTMMASPLAKGLFHKAISQSGGLSLTSVEVAENYQDDDQPGHRLSSREIVNQLIISRGQATSREEAKRQQDDMSHEALAALLYDLSPQDLLGLYSGFFGGMLGNPDIFGDGYVLPADKNANVIFSNTDSYNSVPVILGTNRDEVKLFMAFSSDDVSRTFGIPSGFNNLAEYNRDSAYNTDGWKIRAVDDLATAMKNAQGSQVFAYRFDVDDWRNLGFINLKDLFGAAHALEVPFVFGNFVKPLRVIFPDSMQDEFDTVSAAMRSYWAEFAHTGSPGSGRSGDLARWLPWSNSAGAVPRLMVFDTESDQGIKMVSDRISLLDLRQRLLADRSFTSQKEHCDLYERTFTGDNFVASEYANLGISGCTVMSGNNEGQAD